MTTKITSTRIVRSLALTAAAAAAVVGLAACGDDSGMSTEQDPMMTEQPQG
ncbi:hypothetical protein [Brachybacterium huguangmaarense]